MVMTFLYTGGKEQENAFGSQKGFSSPKWVTTNIYQPTLIVSNYYFVGAGGQTEVGSLNLQMRRLTSPSTSQTFLQSQLAVLKRIFSFETGSEIRTYSYNGYFQYHS